MKVKQQSMMLIPSLLIVTSVSVVMSQGSVGMNTTLVMLNCTDTNAVNAAAASCLTTFNEKLGSVAVQADFCLNVNDLSKCVRRIKRRCVVSSTPSDVKVLAFQNQAKNLNCLERLMDNTTDAATAEGEGSAAGEKGSGEPELSAAEEETGAEEEAAAEEEGSAEYEGDSSAEKEHAAEEEYSAAEEESIAEKEAGAEEESSAEKEVGAEEESSSEEEAADEEEKMEGTPKSENDDDPYEVMAETSTTAKTSKATTTVKPVKTIQNQQNNNNRNNNNNDKTSNLQKRTDPGSDARIAVGVSGVALIIAVVLSVSGTMLSSH